MSDFGDIDAVVFDVLGTMVDEPSGLRSAIAEAAPSCGGAALDALVATWQRHVESAQHAIAQGHRAYAPSGVIDAEAAERVVERAGITSADVIARLGAAGSRLPAWDDSRRGLERISHVRPVLGLSNACQSSLLRLNAYAGLRWHAVLSAESAQAYKPAPEVYRLAVDVIDRPADRVLMVAAHAWDLRGAQSVGMRTAYVRRPVGDAPERSDRFDWQFDGLDALAAALTA